MLHHQGWRSNVINRSVVLCTIMVTDVDQTRWVRPQSDPLEVINFWLWSSPGYEFRITFPFLSPLRNVCDWPIFMILGEITCADKRINPMSCWERSGRHLDLGLSKSPDLNPGSDFDLGRVCTIWVLLLELHLFLTPPLPVCSTV